MVNALDPDNRLGYDGDLHKITAHAAAFVGIGEPKHIEHIAEGYEDCNLKVQSDSGTYVCKLFADNQLGDYSKTRRGSDVTDRVVEIIQAVEANGVQTPKLLRGMTGYLYREDGLVALFYQWLNGSTYYELGRSPTETELNSIIKQAALINTTFLKPIYYDDIWAVPHIHTLTAKVRPYLSSVDIDLISHVIRRFDAIKIDELPKCLVHGDLTKGNVIVATDNKPYILDFSVTNWTTRIIELVLIISNLTYEEASEQPLKERARLVADIYQQYNPLTRRELDALPDLSLAGSAMEFLGSVWRQKFLNDDSEETKYWLQLGQKTLTRELS